MAVSILVTDQDLVVQGDPITGWTALDSTLKFNEPGPGQVTLPAVPAVLDQLQSGNRLVVINDGQIWAAGPMEIPQEGDRSAVTGPGHVTVHFADDLAQVAGRITYPDPALAASSASQPAERVFSAVNTETILRTLASENAGPAALTARRVPGLVLGAAAGAGSTATFRTRFEDLGDALRTVAAIDGLGFRTRQVGTTIEFQVYAPADLTGSARFSEGLGNLRQVKYKISAPTCTHAIVGGGGEGADRVIVEVTDAAAEAAWWRVEKFIDRRDVADNAAGELTAAGNEALAEGAGAVELSTVIIDTEDLKAGRDFALGDKVSVGLLPGLQVAELVRQMQLQATPKDGARITSTVGTAEATTDEQLVGVVRELGRRLGRLETR